jgi:hypothetical protein
MVIVMPSAEHESHIQVSKDLRLTRFFLEKHGLAVPDLRYADERPARITKIVPATYEADGMQVCRDEKHRRVLGVVREVQLSYKYEKKWTWPLYAAHLHAEQKGLPVVLMVYCPRENIAESYRKMFQPEKSPYLQMKPVVYSPADAPLVTDRVAAKEFPALAVFSALAHRADPGVMDALPALSTAVAAAGEQSAIYYDAIRATLPEAARIVWESAMTKVMGNYQFQTPYLREAQAEGRAEGRTEGRTEAKVEDVLTALELRGVRLTQADRERISTCADLDLLDVWFRNALTAASASDVFTKRS